MPHFQNPMKLIVRRLSRTAYVHAALVDRVDLSAFRQRPDLKVITGVTAIAVSYVIGWPLIGLLGIAAVHYGNAAIVAVGGPVAYGFSHLVFLLGMFLAGARYSRIFLRWAVFRTMLRLMHHYRLPLPEPALADVTVMAGNDEQRRRHGPQHGGQSAPPAPSRADGQTAQHGKG